MSKRDEDAIPRAVAHGFLWGAFCFIVMLFFGASCLTTAHENERRNYLRRHVARMQQYTPCANAGFDWAMGVDCDALRDAKAPAKP